MSYVDGYILPLPAENVEAYRAMAQCAGQIWIEHGALSYRECLGDDLNSEWASDSFPKAVNASANEKVIFAFIEFESREHRDEVNAKVYEDPRLEECGDMEDPPFDFKRMAYGGFQVLVNLHK